MTTPDLPNPVLADVVRSGFTESRHRGTLVLLGPDGEVAVAAGAVRAPMFPRSSNKPIQAAAMLDCGLRLDGALLALAAASHSGEQFHVEGVREILHRAGLSEADLQCPPEPDRIHMNCSGKHAAMLATCVASGWPTVSYRDPGHPLQVRIAATIERLAAEPVAATGVDGCGAPVFAISLAGLARAFRMLVLAEPGTAERRVADAMRAHPVWMSGTGRPDAVFMGAVPGLLVKSGAEGVCAFALADGRAGAVKIDDGAQRAVPPVVAAVLSAITGPPGGANGGAAAPAISGADPAAFASLASPPVIGGGEPVGQIKPVLPAGL